jgi:hypothetical protein
MSKAASEVEANHQTSRSADPHPALVFGVPQIDLN